jgi:hypothetical protein
MTRTLLLALGLAACSPDSISEGTAVGNLDATLKFATPTEADVQDLAGTLLVGELSLLRCDQSTVTLASGLTLPLDGSGTLAIPTGEWCGARLTPSAPAAWSASSSAGFALDIRLDLGSLELRSSAPITFAAGDTILWALGDRPWLNAAALGADTADVRIAPGDPRHDALVALVRRDQALVRDDDDDGSRDDDDDVLGEPEDEDDDGTEDDDPPDTSEDPPVETDEDDTDD